MPVKRITIHKPSQRQTLFPCARNRATERQWPRQSTRLCPRVSTRPAYPSSSTAIPTQSRLRPPPGAFVCGVPLDEGDFTTNTVPLQLGAA